MRATIKDYGHEYKYDKMLWMKLENGRLSIGYEDEKGEYHEEFIDASRDSLLPEYIYIGEELVGTTEHMHKALMEAKKELTDSDWKKYSEELSKNFFNKQIDGLEKHMETTIHLSDSKAEIYGYSQICDTCGHEFRDLGADYCPGCGRKIKGE